MSAHCDWNCNDAKFSRQILYEDCLRRNCHHSLKYPLFGATHFRSSILSDQINPPTTHTKSRNLWIPSRTRLLSFPKLLQQSKPTWNKFVWLLLSLSLQMPRSRVPSHNPRCSALVVHFAKMKHVPICLRAYACEHMFLPRGGIHAATERLCPL